MSMCRVFSCVVGRGCLLWPVRSLGKILLVFPCFIPYSKAKFTCYSRCFLTSYFCIPVPYNEKDIFLVFSFERSCRSTSSIMGLMATACKRAYAIHNSAAFRAPVPMAVYCSTIHPPETLQVNSVSVSVSPWVLVCIRFICALWSRNGVWF